MSKIVTVILAACCCAATGAAQNRVIAGHSMGGHGPGVGRPLVSPGAHARTVRITGNGFERRGFHRPFRGAGFIGGYGWPYLYDDYAESYEPEPAPAAQPATVAPVQMKAEPVPDPVLLELRGNQWVKVDTFTSAAALGSGMPVTSIPAKSSAPAVLVYRDGRSEELSSYSIIGPVIYTKGDYWSSGNWTRKIQIADLDLPATFKQNQDRGVKFELPSGPDEVMIRP